MRKNAYLILAILLISSIMRLYKLGSIPIGLSSVEARFVYVDPFLIRLPFALLGIFSVYLLFALLKKLFVGEKYALICSAFLAVLPWAVQESRIFSLGMVFLAVFLSVACLFAQKIKKYWRWLLKSAGFAVIVFFLLSSVLFISPNATSVVNRERREMPNELTRLFSKIFINKFVENYREKERILFQYLDFGNYLFAGHPRERWGVEEIYKIPLSLLIILIVWKVNLKNGKKYLYGIAIALLFFELSYFYVSYFSGYTESLFSPRRPIYIPLAEKIKSIRRTGEKILITDRLKDPKIFFNYYFGGNIVGFEFRSFRYTDEKEKNKLFVDVLPDNANPTEPLYTIDGKIPTDLDILAEFYDSGLRQKVFIYRLK